MSKLELIRALLPTLMLCGVSIEEWKKRKEPLQEKLKKSSNDYSLQTQKILSNPENLGFLETMRKIRLQRSMSGLQRFEIIRSKIMARLKEKGVSEDAYQIVFHMDTVYDRATARENYGIEQSGQLDIFIYFRKTQKTSFTFLENQDLECVDYARREDDSRSKQENSKIIENTSMPSFIKSIFWAELFLRNWDHWFHDENIRSDLDAYIILNAVDLKKDNCHSAPQVSIPVKKIEAPITAPPAKPERLDSPEEIKLKKEYETSTHFIPITLTAGNELIIQIDIYHKGASQEFAVISFTDAGDQYRVVLDLQPEKRYPQQAEIQHYLLSWFLKRKQDANFSAIALESSSWGNLLFSLLVKHLSDSKKYPFFQGSEFLKDCIHIATQPAHKVRPAIPSTPPFPIEKYEIKIK